MRRAILLAVALLWTSIAAAQPAPDLVVQRAGQPAKTVAPAEFATIAVFTQRVPLATAGHGTEEINWTGPKLWDVLTAAGAVDPAKPAEHVRLAVKVKGADGYVATLALGEISPEFAGHPIQLADHRNGAKLDTLRLVVPGEKRGGRSVRDVVRIDVE